MFKKVFIILVVLITVLITLSDSQADPQTQNGDSAGSETDPEIALINGIIDNQVISSLKEFIGKNNVEPISLPGYEQNFQVSIFKGRIKLTNGKIRGYSSITRNGDVVRKYQTPNLLIEIPLSFNKFQLTYNLEANFAGFDIKGQLESEVDKYSLSVDTEIDTTTLKASLMGFALGSSGEPTIKIIGDGTSPEWVLNTFSAIVIPHLKPLAKSVVDETSMEFANAAIQLYNYSF